MVPLSRSMASYASSSEPDESRSMNAASASMASSRKSMPVSASGGNKDALWKTSPPRRVVLADKNIDGSGRVPEAVSFLRRSMNASPSAEKARVAATAPAEDASTDSIGVGSAVGSAFSAKTSPDPSPSRA